MGSEMCIRDRGGTKTGKRAKSLSQTTTFLIFAGFIRQPDGLFGDRGWLLVLQGAGRSSTSSKATTVLHSTYIYLSIPLTMPKGNFERGSHVLAVLLKFVKSTALYW